jgi:hypothetical protein
VIPFNFIEILKSAVAEEIKTATEQLAMGMGADWGDYRERVGDIKGLKKLDRIITELTEDKKVT